MLSVLAVKGSVLPGKGECAGPVCAQEGAAEARVVGASWRAYGERWVWRERLKPGFLSQGMMYYPDARGH